MRKLINLKNNVVELNSIKAISINGYIDLEPKTNRIKIEFKSRKEYVYNPNIELWDLETFNDILFIDYPNYEIARASLDEMFGEWQAYLDEED